MARSIHHSDAHRIATNIIRAADAAERPRPVSKGGADRPRRNQMNQEAALHVGQLAHQARLRAMIEKVEVVKYDKGALADLYEAEISKAAELRGDALRLDGVA